jgi:hypothetical protein
MYTFYVLTLTVVTVCDLMLYLSMRRRIAWLEEECHRLRYIHDPRPGGRRPGGRVIDCATSTTPATAMCECPADKPRVD